MSEKSERREARSVVAAYHQARLDELLAHVADAVDAYRAGELDAFDMDRVVLQYSRAAKELWKFCNYGRLELTAAMIQADPPGQWWELGAPREH